jgi:hypothetical protein
MGDIPVKVKGVYADTRVHSSPVVLLCDGSERVVPIYVGILEAISINSALHNEVPPRPMTHDLIVSMLESFSAEITKVLIDDLDYGTFYARLTVKFKESLKEFDARPSDCIALALRTGADVFMSDMVFMKASVNKEDLKHIVSSF